ncbi:hypothetical protein, partial [Akkermansia sp.]|uniref:hypothetical protein n=1 Tax=Akkermansia sp. TaxID=1872421 RepID=UPI003AAD1365
ILTCPFIPLCRAPSTRITKQWNKDTCCLFLFTKDIVFVLESFLLANADSIEKKNGVLPLDGGRRDFPEIG